MMRFTTRVVLPILLSSAAYAMTPAQGFCEQGGAVVVTSNKSSTTKVQQSFPSCTVTVYLNGTTTLATIYSDNSSTPLANPFTANTKGYWEFYAADGRYDVRLSGGGISTPFLILRDVVIISSSGGGGGGSPGGSSGQCQYNNSGSFGGITGCTTSGTSVTLTSPTFVTPALGTPASGVGTNLTGIPPGAVTSAQGNGSKFQLSTGTTTTDDCVKFDANGNTVDAGAPCGSGGSGGAFSSITSGTNTTATMTVGSGASIVRSGTGIIDANQILSTTLTGISGMVKMTAGIPSAGTSGTDYVGPTTATTYTAGAKQTFSQSATTAGINFGILTNDPSVPAQGDIWYNSGVLMFRDSSATRTIATLTNTQTLTNKTLTAPIIADFTNATHSHQNATGGGTLDAAAIASGLLPVARGGTGLASPSLVGGSGVTVTGTWPNQTISATPASGCSAVGATGVVQASNGSSGCQATSITDNGTTVTTTEPIVAPSISTGGSPPSVTCGTGGCFGVKEGTAPSVCPTSAVDCVYGDSTQHGLLANFNNSSYLPIVLGPTSSTSNDLACWNSINGGLIKDCTALPSSTTGTTQSISDNSTKIATTAYVDRVAPVPTFSTQTDAATITWAIASVPVANATVTLGGNRTLNITNPVNGGSYVLKIVQDATGSRGLTLGTGCTWKVSGGGSGAITPSTAANAIDILTFTYDGTSCYANFAKNYN